MQMNDHSEGRATTCPLCNSLSIKLYDARDRLYGLPGAFELRECSVCSVIFTYPRLSSQEIAVYYPTVYNLGRHETDKINSLDDFSFRKKRILRRTAREKHDIILQYTGKGRLLDIGCNTGELLAGLKLLGWEKMFGLEISKATADYVERSLRVKVWNAAFPDISLLAGEKFDVINLSHSFEHFRDPVQALDSISDLLSPSGICLITIPNPDSLDAKWFDGAWFGYDIPRHYFSYKPHVFRSLVKNRGFDVLDQSFTDYPHGAMLLNIAFSLQNTKWAAYWQKIARFLSIGVISACFKPIYKVLLMFGNTPSMTYVLRKS